MKTPVAVKALGLLALAVASSVATNHLAGQISPKPAAVPVLPAPPTSDLAVTTAGPSSTRSGVQPLVAPPGPRSLQDLLGTRGLGASAQTLEFSAQSFGHGEVGVHQVSYLFDRNPGRRFMWVLRVYAEDKTTLLLERRYAEQATVMTEQIWKPSFDEVLKLDPGTYLIRLRIQAVPHDLDAASLMTVDLPNYGRLRADGSGFVTVAL